MLRRIRYCRPELNLWVRRTLLGRISGERILVVLEILEVNGRVCGRAGSNNTKTNPPARRKMLLIRKVMKTHSF